jgi:hypothetical protein
MMQVTIERSKGMVKVSANEPVSNDVLAMIGGSDLVHARMRHTSKAVFEVQVRGHPCGCARVPIRCRCKESAQIVEVGERIA